MPEASAPQDLISEAIYAALSDLVSAGSLKSDALAGLTTQSIPLERPKNREHGDYASSIALTLAKNAGRNPREIATDIAGRLAQSKFISKVDIAGPGFINLTLAKDAQGAIVTTILNQREKFGTSEKFSGEKINLEFISANPTGPLHLGHTRWAAVGDALASVLQAAGAAVVREFYINEIGRAHV